MRVLLAFLVVFWCGTGAAVAQQSYVQIEAHASLAEALSRARGYAVQLPNVNGFALGGRWHAVTLGPYPTPAAAEAALRQLRALRAVPSDSYITQGESYRDRFWPVGAGAIDGIESASAAMVEPVEIAPAPPPADETPRQARQSEATLSRPEREDLQRALRWFDFYTAAIDGSFGRGTRASMAAWQADRGLDVTGVLTTAQRATLISDWREAQAELGLRTLTVPEAGIALTAPLGLVAYDRIEAPFVHYEARAGSGVRMSLISQPGDRAVLGGLYEVLQTLEMIPTDGPRAKERDAFRIRGEAEGRTTQAFARLRDGHIVGFILSWPPEQARAAERALEEMEPSLVSVGAPLDPSAGFDASEQSFDMVSGLEVRRPLRSGSGFFVAPDGTVVTAAANVTGCGRVTLDRLHEAQVVTAGARVAVLRPEGGLAPARVADLAASEGRLRSRVAVGGYPFGGVLGAATQTFGTLEDVRGLNGEADLLRLSLAAEDGDVGGPVLDGAGQVTGLLLPPPDLGARALPDDVAFAVKSDAILAALTEAGLPAQAAAPGLALAPEDLSKRASAITVLVSCWE